MFISNELAQEIVSKIKDTIHQDINYMDANSIIIASTDSERIGDYHEGSEISIKTQNKLFIENDNQYSGSKKGINMPITLNDQIIGVLGITGEVSEVSQFGEIIKKMTEILIREQSLQDIHNIEAERARLIIEEILLSSEKSHSEYSNTILGYKLNRAHHSIFCQVDIHLTAEIQYILNNKISHYFSTKDTILPLKFDDKTFYFITTLDKKEIHSKVSAFNDDLCENMKINLSIGIGLSSNTLNGVRNSFLQARNVCKWNRLNNSSALFFEDLELGIILTSIPENIKDYYIESILSKIPEGDINKLKNIVISYEKNNRSVQAAAKELFMHKNTFQYQLSKINEYTGYNPIVLSDFVILKLAFSLI